MSMKLRNFLLVGLLFLTTAQAFGEAHVNLGFGYGDGTQEYAKKYEFSSVGGHGDLMFRWLIFEVGGSFLSLSQLDTGGRKTYVEYYGANLGFAFSKYLELLGGVGVGRWRRQRSDQEIAPIDSDYTAFGTGYMAGIRLFLINTKEFSMGLSASYYRMNSDSYHSNEDLVRSVPFKDIIATGSMAAIVFRWSGEKIGGKGGGKLGR